MSLNLIGVGVLVLIFAGLLFFTRKAGKDAERAAEGQRDGEAAARVAQAVGDSPHTSADILERLRDKTRDV